MNAVYQISQRKRRIERVLRTVGLSRAEAKRAVGRLSRIASALLGWLAASASFIRLVAWRIGL